MSDSKMKIEAKRKEYEERKRRETGNPYYTIDTSSYMTLFGYNEVIASASSSSYDTSCQSSSSSYDYSSSSCDSSSYSSDY